MAQRPSAAVRDHFYQDSLCYPPLIHNTGIFKLIPRLCHCQLNQGLDGVQILTGSCVAVINFREIGEDYRELSTSSAELVRARVESA